MELNSPLGEFLLSLHLNRVGGDQREDENLGNLSKHICLEECFINPFRL